MLAPGLVRSARLHPIAALPTWYLLPLHLRAVRWSRLTRVGGRTAAQSSAPRDTTPEAPLAVVLTPVSQRRGVSPIAEPAVRIHGSDRPGRATCRSRHRIDTPGSRKLPPGSRQ